MTPVLFSDKLYDYELTGIGIGVWALAPEQPFKVQTAPSSRWSGAKIPMPMWQQILSFFAWTYKTYKGESQVRLLYNPTAKVWAAHAFPQSKRSGLSTDELGDHPNFAIDMKMFEGFEFVGTVHHHCNISAFASSTDKADERNRVGLHITIGKLESEKYELHSRVVAKRPALMDGDKVVRAAEWIESTAILSDWFDLGPVLSTALPEDMHSAVLAELLIRPSDAEFPERWKENVIEEPLRSYATTGGLAVTGYFGVPRTLFQSMQPAAPVHQLSDLDTDDLVAINQMSWDQFCQQEKEELYGE